MKILILGLFISFNIQAATCEGQVDLTLETDEKIILCEVQGNLVDQKCSLLKENCPILKFVKTQKKTPEIEKALKIGAIGRPGSRICNILKLKVLMGEMKDGSQICVCMDERKNYLSCNVPQNHFE